MRRALSQSLTVVKKYLSRRFKGIIYYLAARLESQQDSFFSQKRKAYHSKQKKQTKMLSSAITYRQNDPYGAKVIDDKYRDRTHDASSSSSSSSSSFTSFVDDFASATTTHADTTPCYRSPMLQFATYIVEANGRPREYADVYDVLSNIAPSRLNQVFVMVSVHHRMMMMAIGRVRCRLLGKMVDSEEIETQNIGTICELVKQSDAHEIEKLLTEEAEQIKQVISDLIEKPEWVTIVSIWIQSDRSSIGVSYSMAKHKWWVCGEFVRACQDLFNCHFWLHDITSTMGCRWYHGGNGKVESGNNSSNNATPRD